MVASFQYSEKTVSGNSRRIQSHIGMRRTIWDSRQVQSFPVPVCDLFVVEFDIGMFLSNTIKDLGIFWER